MNIKKLTVAVLVVVVATAAFVWRSRMHEGAVATAASPTLAGAAGSASASTGTASVNPVALDAAPVSRTQAASAATLQPDPHAAVATGPALVRTVPAESQLMFDKGLRSEQADAVLASPDFDRFMDRLSREADAKALATTRLYQDRIAGSLAPQEDFKVERVSCGAQVCAATVSAGQGDEAELLGLLLAPETGPKLYAIMSHMEPKGPGNPNTQYRFLFTTDPKKASIEVH